MSIFKTEPARVLAIVQAVIVVAVVFGIDISDDQKEAILALVGAFLSLGVGELIRSRVTPA